MGPFLLLVGLGFIALGLLGRKFNAMPGLGVGITARATSLVAAGAVALVIGSVLAANQAPGPTRPSTDETAEKKESSPSLEPSPLQISPEPAQPAAEATTPHGIPPGAQKATVSKIVDGDTIWVTVSEPGGAIPPGLGQKIRLLEIDTPEKGRCFFQEAARFAADSMPLGTTVYLLADKEDKDRYGRYLRYVWEQDGEFFNEKAVREGVAKAVLYRPNDLYIARMRNAEAEARSATKGFWKSCVGGTAFAARTKIP